MSIYSSRLRDPRWQRRRLEVLEKALWRCSQCGEEKKELQVHHLIYRKGNMPWEYADEDLAVLCVECHELATDAKAAIDQGMINLKFPGQIDGLLTVLGFIDGRMKNPIKKMKERNYWPYASAYFLACDVESKPKDKSYQKNALSFIKSCIRGELCK
jgi:hypothetical protein